MNYNDYYINSKKIRIKYLMKAYKKLLLLKNKYNSEHNNKTNIYEVFNELQNSLFFSKKETKDLIYSCLKHSIDNNEIIIDDRGYITFL